VVTARRSLVATLETYADGLRPASRSFVATLVAYVSAAYPAARVGDGDAELRLHVYADALSDVPADLLAHGARAAIRTSRFMPTPAEILTAREDEADPSAGELLRLRRSRRDRFAAALASTTPTGLPIMDSKESSR
jgi:hypothetical protein